MYKLAAKCMILAFAVVGVVTLCSGSKALAYACPGGLTGSNVPADYGYGAGEAADGFAGAVVASSIGSGNGWNDTRNGSRIDQANYFLQSYVPDAPVGYRYNLGGRPQNDRIFTVDSGNNTTSRTDGRWFGTGSATGDQLYANPSDNGYTCAGWDALGPGRVYTAISPNGTVNYEEAGNRHALDCGESYFLSGNPNPQGKTATQFWIGQIPNPNGEDGHWEVHVYGASNDSDIDVGNIGASPMGPNSGTHFEVTNGATIRINLIWHADKPKPQGGGNATGNCTSLDVANWGSGNPNRRREYVVATGVSVGKLRVYDSSGNLVQTQDYPNYPGDPARPRSIAAWVGAGGNPPDGSNGIGPGENGQRKLWNFVPWDSNTVHVKVTIEDYWDNNGDGTKTWNYVGGYDNTYTCYSATCKVLDTSGNGPGGIVLAGDIIHVHAQLTNTSADGLQLWNPPLSDYGGNLYGSNVVLDPNDTHDYYFDIRAPSSVQTYNPTFFPVYFGRAGADCNGSVPVYQYFTAGGGAYSRPLPTKENPDHDNYYTQVTVNSTSYPVNLTANSKFTKNGSPLVTDSGGQYTGTSYPLGRDANGANWPITSPVAGDQYCASINITPTSGYVGPDHNVLYPLGNQTWSDCGTVTNEPFFKVYGSGVSARDGLSDPSGNCSATPLNSGLLAGWNDNLDYSADRGSGSQLSALALLKITGVASAQTDITRAPTDLTFANSNAADITGSRDNPYLAGNFGGTPVCTAAPSAATATVLPSSTVSIGSMPASNTGNYQYNGNLTINGGTVNRNMAIYVNGDVYIKRTFLARGILHGQNSWALGSVPSFVLVATGNVYIDPSVTQLDGVYIARPKDAKDATTGGTIYTCGTASFQPNNDFTACNNQLLVNGSFKANTIKLLRTFGTLRDESPPSHAPFTGCNNAGTQMTTATCAAEVFQFSPELYLTTPAPDPPNKGAVQYDAITSLPPVL